MELFYTVACVVVIVFIAFDKWLDHTRPNLNFIPTIGPSGRYTSLWRAMRYVWIGRQMVAEGTAKFRMFKMPALNKWYVVLSNPELIDDLRRAKEDVLSFGAAVDELIFSKYNLGDAGAQNDEAQESYHIHVLKTTFTKNLDIRFPDMYDEIVSSFNEEIKAREHEWVEIPAQETFMQIICRTGNRALVGIPLCRDPDFCDLNKKFTSHIVVSVSILNLVPKILHPFVGPIVSALKRSIRRADKGLGKLLRQRMQDDAKLGVNRPDRPDDMITWLLDAAPEDERTPHKVIQKILALNFASIHSSTNIFVQAAFQLAARPEYVQPLREEVQNAISEAGWTRAAVGQMRKVDSFIRESARLQGNGAINMSRLVMKPEGFTFSDGTTLPQGTTVFVSPYSMHHSEDNYSNPLEFNGFRFSDMVDDGKVEPKNQLVNTGLDFLLFGHGRHACPGRFFAATELKTMLAYIVMNYDVKLADGVMPKPVWLGPHCVADSRAKILFKKRQQ